MTEPQGLDEAFGASAGQAREYVRLLGSIGLERGLLGPREVPRLWDRHVCNSANAASLLPPSSSVADVGSGAGLPGIPLALMRPDVRVTLIESMLRRTAFLEEVVATLGLSDRVRVVRSRAEEVQESFDVVTSRAVAPLGKLLPWCLPLVAEHGLVLALKGESATEEVAAVRGLLRDIRGVAQVIEVAAYEGWSKTRVVSVAPQGVLFHVKRHGCGKS